MQHKVMITMFLLFSSRFIYPTGSDKIPQVMIEDSRNNQNYILTVEDAEIIYNEIHNSITTKGRVVKVMCPYKITIMYGTQNEYYKTNGTLYSLISQDRYFEFSDDAKQIIDLILSQD